MNNNYVILNINRSSDLDKNIIIDLIKVDKVLNIFDKLKLEIGDGLENNILEFINFCKNSVIVVSKRKETLSLVLELLYKNKIYNKFKFKYIDIGDINFNSSIDIYNYLYENSLINLDELLFLQDNHGRIFRGITYPKYLCDIKINNNKYYGYIIDFSKDKYVSYYSYLKEINEEYFNIEEVQMLEEKGGKIILNVNYLSDESLTLTNYYSVVSLDDKLDNYIEYKKKNKDLKLVLWGSKNKKNYDLIDVVKEPWGYWSVDDIR